MANYIDFYGYGDMSSGNEAIITADSKSSVQKVVMETITEDLSFVPNGENVDVLMSGKVVGSFRVPDEAAFEDATYNKDTKAITFTYDQDGVEGEKSVDLSDLVDVYNGEKGISVNDKNISVKYDENTMEITEDGELKAKSDNLWGEI